MEDFLIPGIDEAVIERLEERAARAGKTLEELVREILTETVKSAAEEHRQK